MRREISDTSRLENLQVLVNGTVELALGAATPDAINLRSQARNASGYSPTNNGTRVNGTIVRSGFLRFNSAPGLGANE